MAQIVIAGKAIVVTSAMKLEDIKTIKKYRPNALILKGGEDGKEPIFALTAGSCGEINKYGIVFSDATRDDSRLATLTMTTDYDGDDIEELVADKFGTALINLKKLEETLPDVIEEITAEKEAIMDNIAVIQ